MKVLLPLVALVIGIAMAAVIFILRPEVERKPEPPPAPLVRIVEARRSNPRVDVQSQGTVAPRTQTTLSTQVAGRIQWVSPRFAEGAFFSAGEPLVRIAPEDFRLAVTQAEAQVAQAQVQLAQQQAEAAVAREEWRSLGRGEPTPLVLRQPQLEQARAALQAARANVEQARLSLSRTEVRAPYAGRISAQRTDLGQFVAVGAALADIYATDYAEVRLPVQEKDLAFLPVELGYAKPAAAGPAVELRGDVAGGARTWSARVVRVAAAIDPKTRLLDLFARVDDPFNRERNASGAPLPMGLFVEATLRGRELSGVFVIPRAALRGENQVLVVDAESRLRFRTVDVMRTEADAAFISAGLNEGEQIVVSPMETPVDGMTVRTTPAEKTPAAMTLRLDRQL